MEPLSDPMNDRQVPSIIPPPALPLKTTLLYPNGNHKPPDWELLKQHFQQEGYLHQRDCEELIIKTTRLLKSEPNLLRLQDPITVVGDIHGQYYDLLKLLEIGGDPHNTQYLFLGDYVDRGSFSIEVCLLLYSLKLNFPLRITLLRGNHECRQMTSYFNFKSECLNKYNLNVYNLFMESFDALPLAATINGRFLAVHGGISPELKTLAQLANLNRFLEPPRAGLFCDLLWSDPTDEDKTPTNNKMDAFQPNEVRGCSYFFGYRAACNFLEKTGLLSIIRGHEAQLEGYKMHHSSAKTGFPTVITIFSAPNYCDVYNNKGAVLKFENNTLNIQQFNFSPHPYHLTNFMDVFSWSIPFLSEKVSEILFGLLNSSFDEIDDDETIDSLELPYEIQKIISSNSEAESRTKSNISIVEINEKQKSTLTASPLRDRAEQLKIKVQTIGRLQRVFRTLREERELIVKLKDCTPANRIPIGLLLQGRDVLVDHLEKFNNAKIIDAQNERWPDSKKS